MDNGQTGKHKSENILTACDESFSKYVIKERSHLDSYTIYDQGAKHAVSIWQSSVCCSDNKLSTEASLLHRVAPYSVAPGHPAAEVRGRGVRQVQITTRRGWLTVDSPLTDRRARLSRHQLIKKEVKVRTDAYESGNLN